MDQLNIKVPKDTSITVLGDIHEHNEQFFSMAELIQPSDKRWLVSVGDVYDKGYGTEVAESITEYLRGLSEKGYGWVARGNHEISRYKKAEKENKLTEALRWWNEQPLALSFVFDSFRLTVVHGGVTPAMTFETLAENNSNINKIPYIRNLDENGEYIPLIWKKNENGREELVEKVSGGKPWHESYRGNLGFIASGHHAQKDGVAKFFSHSCNLDSGVYVSGILTAQIFTENGPGEILRIQGKARKTNG